MYYKNISEEELKSRVGEDYFSGFDHKTTIGKVDFCVLPKKNRNQTDIFKQQSLLWAEAKANKRDIIDMFAQLILTIGKARTFNQYLPPAFLGVFDAEKTAFVPYEEVSDLFRKNDFNWNVAPSNRNTKEFSEIKDLINDVLNREKQLYYFGKDDENLRLFIKNNLAKGTEDNRARITKNNFTCILDRKDLLVPQDFRERKGAYFTPRQWVELSQKHIADVLGENWQEEYYVWDCCAGSGNLLRGLTNKYNVYASTLDQGDVEDVKGKAKENKVNLLEKHVFQFDFLNDDFFGAEQNLHNEKGETRKTTSKLPKSLQEILKDPEKRKKLVVYINPPYAEAGNSRTITNTGEHKTGASTNNNVYRRYRTKIGKASNELFAQFLIRIYCEIPRCVLANFSKLKNLQAPNFSDFRENFQAKLEAVFLAPANTFDNVKGKFPIGFFIWDTAKKEEFQQITADVFDKKGNLVQQKNIQSHNDKKKINQWITEYKLDNRTEKERIVGFLEFARSNDFQNIAHIHIRCDSDTKPAPRGTHITPANIIPSSIYLAAGNCIEATWLNDRDQFLYPNDSWLNDTEFHSDCLAFALFHGQNRITSKNGTNHWIPFAEEEVNAQEKFASNFMNNFMNGKIKTESEQQYYPKRQFSPQARDVFVAGKELWRYYHSQKDVNTNASLYDIREHFQGRNEKNLRMNNSSKDEKYSELIGALRKKLDPLADKIAEKVYEHGLLSR